METDAPPPKPRSRRRRAGRLGVGVLSTLLMLTLLVGLAALMLTNRVLVVPDWIVDKVETRINDRLRGPAVDLGGIEVEIARDARPSLRLRDVTVRDSTGAPIAVLNRLGASLDPGALLEGELAPRRLRLNGAQVTLRRDAQGGLVLMLGTGGGMAFPGVSGLLDAVEAAFDRPPLDRIASVEMTDLTVVVEDARSSRVWQVTGGQARLTQSDTALDATLAAEIFDGTDDLAQAQLSLTSRKGDGRASLTARLTGAPARDIALQSPALAFLGVLDAPISGALRGTLDEAGKPESVAGTLEIGAGEIRPNQATEPVAFDSGRLYFSFDPERDRLEISQLAAVTPSARIDASGHAYLRDKGPGGWPRALVAQIVLSRFDLDQPGLLAAPLAFTSGAIDARLRLDPFTLEVGQFVLGGTEADALHASGSATATPQGWQVAADLSVDAAPVARVLDLWPLPLAPGTRRWLDENVPEGRLTGLTGAMRWDAGEKPRLGASFGFEGAEVRVLDTLPPVTGAEGFASLVDDRFALRMEAGQIAPDMGAPLSLAGSTFVVGDTKQKPARGEVELTADGDLTGILSLLTRPPVNLFADGSRSPDLAQARAAAHVALEVDLGKLAKGARHLEWTAEGTLTGVESDTLLPGRTLAARALSFRAAPDAVTASGNATLDGVPVTARWRQPLGPGDPPGELRGEVSLSPAVLRTFGVDLPDGMVSGQGSGEVTLSLPKGAPPRLVLTSDLRGIGLSLGALGWSKPAGTPGSLEVEMRLGNDPQVERLALSAPGLEAAGAVELAGGGLKAARFSRVRLGGWLDAPVTLTGRGAGKPPAIRVEGGTLDLRKATFGKGGGGQGGGGARGPVEVALDRLVVTQGIALEGARGRLDPGQAISGAFTGRLNGGPPISAEIAGQARGVAVRIRANDAGAVASAAGLLQQGRGGTLEIVLQPTGESGTYEGSATVADTRIVGAPALAELLGAISVVGLLEQMQGQGLVFDDVQARFRLGPERLTLYSSSAVGASLGLSMDGVFDLASRRLDMQGVISPIYLLNGIGQVLTRKGEGLFGFNFRLTGPSAQPEVQVNPLSILTPGMFRELFRRPPPEPPANVPTR